MESTKHRTYRRSDGTLGVGFVLPFADAAQACIAWPDTVPDRIYVHLLEQAGIEDVSEQMPQAAVTMETRKLLEPETVKPPELAPKSPELAVKSPELDANPMLSDAATDTQPHDADREHSLILEYLTEHGLDVTNKSVVDALKAQGVIVTSPQVTAAKNELKNSATPPSPVDAGTEPQESDSE